jgi:DNA-binding transcriptional MerR regulator
MERETYQIGEVAEAVGLSLRTIRHYEEVGLAPPSARSPGGFRLYTDGDIERLRLIKQMKPLDFSLEEMRQLLEARQRLLHGRLGTKEQQRLRTQLTEFADLAEHRIAKLRARLEDAEHLAEMLRDDARVDRA